MERMTRRVAVTVLAYLALMAGTPTAEAAWWSRGTTQVEGEEGDRGRGLFGWFGSRNREIGEPSQSVETASSEESSGSSGQRGLFSGLFSGLFGSRGGAEAGSVDPGSWLGGGWLSGLMGGLFGPRDADQEQSGGDGLLSSWLGNFFGSNGSQGGGLFSRLFDGFLGSRGGDEGDSGRGGLFSNLFSGFFGSGPEPEGVVPPDEETSSGGEKPANDPGQGEQGYTQDETQSEEPGSEEALADLTAFPADYAYGASPRDDQHLGTVTIRHEGERGLFYLFQPYGPTLETTPVVLFLHASLAPHPDYYMGWIDHIVRRGNTVIFPVLAGTGEEEPTPAELLEKAVGLLHEALDTMTNGAGYATIDLDRVALIAHSSACPVALAMATAADSERHPGFQAVLLVEAEASLSEVLSGVSGFPQETLYVCLAGGTDTFAGDDTSVWLFDQLADVPPDGKRYGIVPGLSHLDPLTGGLPAVAGADEKDRLLWEIFNHLEEGAFYGEGGISEIETLPIPVSSEAFDIEPQADEKAEALMVSWLEGLGAE